MRLLYVCVLLLASAGPAAAQAREGCLHTGLETRAEAQRREEALAATRMINSALPYLPNSPAGYPTWEALAQAPAVASLRGMGGPAGDLARKIQWGAPEPLPGWRIHFVTSGEAYAFSLADVSDPCRFTYYSNDSGVIVEGQAIGGRRFGVIPIT